MTTKTFITSANIEKVNGILKSFGYESDMQFLSDDFNLGSIRQNKRYANLGYDDHQGFYISTTGTWMYDEEAIDLYIFEMMQARTVLRYLAKEAGETDAEV